MTPSPGTAPRAAGDLVSAPRACLKWNRARGHLIGRFSGGKMKAEQKIKRTCMVSSGFRAGMFRRACEEFVKI